MGQSSRGRAAKHGEDFFNASARVRPPPRKLWTRPALLATEPIDPATALPGKRLTEIGVEKNTTTSSPLPLEMMTAVQQAGRDGLAAAEKK